MSWYLSRRIAQRSNQLESKSVPLDSYMARTRRRAAKPAYQGHRSQLQPTKCSFSFSSQPQRLLLFRWSAFFASTAVSLRLKTPPQFKFAYFPLWLPMGLAHEKLPRLEM